MNDLSNIFILGLIYGFTTCSFSCIPYLAPYMIGNGGGFREGIKGSVTFVSGKIFTYSLMGGIAAYFGTEVLKMNSNVISYLLGISLIVIGSSIMFKKEKKPCSGKEPIKRLLGQHSKKLPLFVLGIMTSLLPCLPLSALFLMASGSGSSYQGALYGFSFGIGLMISPIVLAGGFFGFLSGRLKMEKPELNGFMKTCSGFILIFMGGMALIRTFQSGI
jgi:thiol:disulfide interchange protein DsbD